MQTKRTVRLHSMVACLSSNAGETLLLILRAASELRRGLALLQRPGWQLGFNALFTRQAFYRTVLTFKPSLQQPRRSRIFETESVL